jgi:hypothetical protein
LKKLNLSTDFDNKFNLFNKFTIPANIPNVVAEAEFCADSLQRGRI